MKSYLPLLIGCFLFTNSIAQQNTTTYNYHSPIDVPIFLSGTFAELRSNHFHSGIDIRTANKPGHKVFAIEDGYVSRIAVSPGGFGKALYIAHPDGHTSVYAHLQQLEGEIANYLKTQQYKQERFEVNLFPPKDLLPVKKGQVIALSGNSGSSEGPHLHFEIRDSKTEETLNPLAFGFKVNDHIKPVIARLVVYPIGNQSYANNSSKRSTIAVSGIGVNEKPKQQTNFEASGEIAFGITASDQLDGVPNSNGIYSVTLSIDNKVFYQFVADRFAFDETRYINSFIDYDFFQNFKSRVMRTEIDPMNKLSMYEKAANKGILKVEEGKNYEAEYIVKDFQGNISRVPFTVKGIKAKPITSTRNDTTLFNIQANKPFEITAKDYFVQFESGNFYRDQLIDCKPRLEKGFLSNGLTVGSKNIPVQKVYKIGIKPNNEKINKDKLLIVSIVNGEKPYAIGGKWENGFVIANVKIMGTFAIMADSIQPQIKAVNFTKGGSVHGLKRLQVEIQDELSGISSYRGTLNGQWILMDYDSKNKLLTYDFDERLKKGKNKLVVKVVDNCGNTNIFTTEISY